MKITTLLLILLIPFFLFAQMEFEEVFKIYPEGGIARYSKVYFKNDTILIKSDVSSPEIIEKEAYYLSTNSGKTFEDISDIVRSSLPILDGDTEPGVFHPTGFFFVKRNFTDKDTSIYYISLDGEIIKKVEYPYRGGFLFSSYIEINDKDPDYLALHHDYFIFAVNTYYHQLSMSTDRGESWNSLSPESIIEKETGKSLLPNRKITTVYSERNKGKLFAEIYYGSTHSSLRHNIQYNYLTDKYNLISNYFDMDYVYNYENFEDNTLDQIVLKRDEIFFSKVDTKERQEAANIYDLFNLNKDSIGNEGERLIVGDYSNGERFSFIRTNTHNFNQKVIIITHRPSTDNDPVLVFRQVFFQTFDNGKTWEYIFENNDLNNRIFNFFIKPTDQSLWLIKDKELENIIYPSSYHPILYKSKSPLTNIEKEDNFSNNLKFELYINNLKIQSEVLLGSTKIDVFNLNGQLLFRNTIQINKGVNSIHLTDIKSNQLLLIRISNNHDNNIYKLIRRE